MNFKCALFFCVIGRWSDDVHCVVWYEFIIIRAIPNIVDFSGQSRTTIYSVQQRTHFLHACIQTLAKLQSQINLKRNIIFPNLVNK